MRVTSLNQLGAALRLPPSSLGAFRQLSLDDVATLNRMIEDAHSRYRSETEEAFRALIPIVSPGVMIKMLRGRHGGGVR